MSARKSNNRTLVIVAVGVIVVAIGVSLMKGRGDEPSTETAVIVGSSATDSAGDNENTPSSGAAAPQQTRSTPDAANARTVQPTASSPDVKFVAWDFVPKTPVRGKPVVVRASIKNDGGKPAPPFTVAWHASADESVPVHVWAVPILNPGARYQLEFEYVGFSIDSAELKTMMVIDPEGVVADRDRTNNEWVRTITVAKQ